MKFVPAKEICDMIGIHPQTMRKWAIAGKISYITTPGGHRRYNIDEFIECAKIKARNRAEKEYCRENAVFG